MRGREEGKEKGKEEDVECDTDVLPDRGSNVRLARWFAKTIEFPGNEVKKLAVSQYTGVAGSMFYI
jgi:hypothetical protein